MTLTRLVWDRTLKHCNRYHLRVAADVAASRDVWSHSTYKDESNPSGFGTAGL